MIDGATDASSVENETVYVRCLGTDGWPVSRLVGHKPVEHAHADGKFNFFECSMLIYKKRN